MVMVLTFDIQHNTPMATQQNVVKYFTKLNICLFIHYPSKTSNL